MTGLWKRIGGLATHSRRLLVDGSSTSLSRESPEFTELIRVERRMWMRFFREWIDQVGAERVRLHVLANLDWFAKRTGPITPNKIPPSEFSGR